MGPYKDWRDLLKEVTQNPQVKQALLQGIGINPVTLNRWLNNVSDPHPENFRRLYLALPQKYRAQFVQLTQRKVGKDLLIDLAIEEKVEPFSYEFYDTILTKRATLTEQHRFHEICDFILSHASKQLAPDNLGICIWLLRCLPPHEPHTKVRSLQELLVEPNHPWPHASILRKELFLVGAESIAGRALMYGRWQSESYLEQDKEREWLVREPHAKSVAAIPIMYATRQAGVLLVLSTNAEFFHSEDREYMLKGYANALALAFKQDEFYNPEDIMLHMFPSQLEQQRLAKDRFQPSLEKITYQTALRRPFQSHRELDIQVYQSLEDLFIQHNMEYKTH
jgi:hypothetical protein